MSATAEEVERVKRLIACLPDDTQRRINGVAAMLRQLLLKDDRGEIELAFTLVIAELAVR
jgi:hypothetical protein